jgi:bifunctional DNase/RNase
MVQIHVKEVVGPLPFDQTCFIIITAGQQIFAIPSSFADAENCHNLLTHESPFTNAFDFLTATLEAVDVKINKVELEVLSGQMYGKIWMKTKGEERPLRLACSNPAILINTALSAEIPIEMSKDEISKLSDVTVEFVRLEACLAHLFPLPHISSTEVLQILSEFVDKALHVQSK